MKATKLAQFLNDNRHLAVVLRSTDGGLHVSSRVYIDGVLKRKTEYEDTWFNAFKIIAFLIVSVSAVNFALFAHCQYFFDYDFMTAVYNNHWAHTTYVVGHMLLACCICLHLLLVYLGVLTYKNDQEEEMKATKLAQFLNDNRQFTVGLRATDSGLHVSLRIYIDGTLKRTEKVISKDGDVLEAVENLSRGFSSMELNNE